MAHDSGSFDYKVINENIRKILDARSQLNNTVQVAMPFVKATTTLRHEEYIGKDNKGFTLGLHGINEDVKYEDMYSDQNGMDPLIGYTYQANGLTKKVYAKNPMTEVYKTAGQILDTQASIFTYPEDSKFVRIPPPGITNVSIGRNKNGLLSVAQIQISIPSLIQLESLHRTFLVPGIGMVLEWGQQFAPYTTNDQFLQKSSIAEYMFPWNNRSKLDRILDRLAKREVGLMEILQEYVYPSNGQYMWMFGRVANFDVKSNSDGSFNANVKIVGPSEDAWAYSTRNTVVPRKDAGSPYFCASDTHSVYSYFANTMAGGLNLKTLLDSVRKGEGRLGAWKEHVAYFEQGNQSQGEPEPTTQTPTTDNRTFADHEDAYFMTWRFFVNVVINDEKVGVRAIFAAAGLSQQLIDTIGLLLPYGNGEERDTNIAKLKVIDDPKESYVGANKYLRSIDPSTLIIVNEKAAELANSNPQYNIPVSEKDLLLETNESRIFKAPTVPFEQSAQVEGANDPDKGFLSSGVWINHKAVVECMLSADTILRGITNLLEAMNQATSNYWQLTLDAVEGEENKNPHTYTVIDANFRDSSNNAVKKFLDKVHVFNKYIRTKSGALVGSELIECSLDLSLPKRLFSQIATLGLLSKDDIEKINQKEVKVGDPVQPNQTDDTFSAKIADPNNTLAEMFGIITLSTKDKTGLGPDLTILPNNQNGTTTSTCGKVNAQLVAGVGGQGYQVANANPVETAITTPSDAKKQFDQSSAAVSSSVCRQCTPCLEAEEAQFIKQPLGLPNGLPIVSANVPGLQSLIFAPSVINSGPLSPQLLYDVNEAFGKQSGVQAYVYSGHRDEDNPASKSNPDSRHLRGLAIDITGIYVNGRYFDSKTSPAAVASINQAVEYLTSTKGYIKTQRESVTLTPKAIIWQSPGHFNHVHISIANDTTVIPPSTTTPAPKDPNTQVCKDEDYQRIGGGNAEEGRNRCRECKKHNDIVKQITQSTQTSVDVAIRKFSGLRQAFRYVEIFPEMMVASIASTADGDKSNAFGASPGSLAISADLILPGINGLRVGELFWVDRIPAFYKVFGAFQILSLEDTIDTGGWKTKIHARFNYLGTAWKKSMTTILTSK